MFKANRNRQWAILSLVIFYIHAAPIHERRKVHHCVEMRCRPDIFDSVTTRLRSSAEVEEECRVCHTCANHGYSVCLHLPRSTLAPFGAKSKNGSSCACAFSVPESCNFPSDSSEESESLHPVDVCFRSALRIPPRPRVVGTKRTVILTVDELWNDPYWKDLDISNLKIHYEFPVAVSEYCDGTVKSTSNDNQLVCSATLNIDLYDYTSGSDDATDGAVKSDNLKERVDYESLPPEIRFDRNVFLGAESVCFWYTVAIRRPRQIEFEIVGHGELNGARLVDINTTTTSTKLTFDLEPQIYGTPEYYDDEEATDSNGLKHTTSKSQTLSYNGRKEKISVRLPNGDRKGDSSETVQHVTKESGGDEVSVTERKGIEAHELEEIESSEKSSDKVPIDTDADERIETVKSYEEDADQVTEKSKELGESSTETTVGYDHDTAVTKTFGYEERLEPKVSKIEEYSEEEAVDEKADSDGLRETVTEGEGELESHETKGKATKDVEISGEEESTKMETAVTENEAEYIQSSTEVATYTTKDDADEIHKGDADQLHYLSGGKVHLERTEEEEEEEKEREKEVETGEGVAGETKEDKIHKEEDHTEESVLSREEEKTTEYDKSDTTESMKDKIGEVESSRQETEQQDLIKTPTVGGGGTIYTDAKHPKTDEVTGKEDEEVWRTESSQEERTTLTESPMTEEVYGRRVSDEKKEDSERVEAESSTVKHFDIDDKDRLQLQEDVVDHEDVKEEPKSEEAEKEVEKTEGTVESEASRKGDEEKVETEKEQKKEGDQTAEGDHQREEEVEEKVEEKETGVKNETEREDEGIEGEYDKGESERDDKDKSAGGKVEEDTEDKKGDEKEDDKMAGEETTEERGEKELKKSDQDGYEGEQEQKEEKIDDKEEAVEKMKEEKIDESEKDVTEEEYSDHQQREHGDDEDGEKIEEAEAKEKETEEKHEEEGQVEGEDKKTEETQLEEHAESGKVKETVEKAGTTVEEHEEEAYKKDKKEGGEHREGDKQLHIIHKIGDGKRKQKKKGGEESKKLGKFRCVENGEYTKEEDKKENGLKVKDASTQTDEDHRGDVLGKDKKTKEEDHNGGTESDKAKEKSGDSEMEGDENRKLMEHEESDQKGVEEEEKEIHKEEEIKESYEEKEGKEGGEEGEEDEGTAQQRKESEKETEEAGRGGEEEVEDQLIENKETEDEHMAEKEEGKEGYEGAGSNGEVGDEEGSGEMLGHGEQTEEEVADKDGRGDDDKSKGTGKVGVEKLKSKGEGEHELEGGEYKKTDEADDGAVRLPGMESYEDDQEESQKAEAKGDADYDESALSAGKVKGDDEYKMNELKYEEFHGDKLSRKFDDEKEEGETESGKPKSGEVIVDEQRIEKMDRKVGGEGNGRGGYERIVHTEDRGKEVSEESESGEDEGRISKLEKSEDNGSDEKSGKSEESAASDESDIGKSAKEVQKSGEKSENEVDEEESYKTAEDGVLKYAGFTFAPLDTEITPEGEMSSLNAIKEDSDVDRPHSEATEKGDSEEGGGTKGKIDEGLSEGIIGEDVKGMEKEDNREGEEGGERKGEEEIVETSHDIDDKRAEGLDGMDNDAEGSYKYEMNGGTEKTVKDGEESGEDEEERMDKKGEKTEENLDEKGRQPCRKVEEGEEDDGSEDDNGNDDKVKIGDMQKAKEIQSSEEKEEREYEDGQGEAVAKEGAKGGKVKIKKLIFSEGDDRREALKNIEQKIKDGFVKVLFGDKDMSEIRISEGMKQETLSDEEKKTEDDSKDDGNKEEAASTAVKETNDNQSAAEEIESTATKESDEMPERSDDENDIDGIRGVISKGQIIEIPSVMDSSTRNTLTDDDELSMMESQRADIAMNVVTEFSAQSASNRSEGDNWTKLMAAQASADHLKSKSAIDCLLEQFTTKQRTLYIYVAVLILLITVALIILCCCCYLRGPHFCQVCFSRRQRRMCTRESRNQYKYKQIPQKPIITAQIPEKELLNQ